LKNDYRQANIIFSSPWHQLWRKMEKNDFRQAKITSSAPTLSKAPAPGCGLSKHQLCRYIQKNDFQQAKTTFSNLGPF